MRRSKERIEAMKQIKQRLNNGEILIGTFLSLGNPVTTEIVANAGFDWVVIDLEHGIGAETDVATQLLALKGTGVAAIVRVESREKQRIHRVLDLGANGIMCPRLHDAREAAEAISAMHYPPLGTRGVAKMIRATGYGASFDEYRAGTADELLGVIQIETLEALEHLDDIANTSGVDVLFIGPSDLSMAMGIFGQTDHPAFVTAVDNIIAAAKRAGKHVGILLAGAADVKKYSDKGVGFIACGTDASFLNKEARQTVTSMNQALGK